MTETILALNTTARNKGRLDRYWANGEILVGMLLILMAVI